MRKGGRAGERTDQEDAPAEGGLHRSGGCRAENVLYVGPCLRRFPRRSHRTSSQLPQQPTRTCQDCRHYQHHKEGCQHDNHKHRDPRLRLARSSIQAQRVSRCQPCGYAEELRQTARQARRPSVHSKVDCRGLARTMQIHPREQSQQPQRHSENCRGQRNGTRPTRVAHQVAIPRGVPHNARYMVSGSAPFRLCHHVQRAPVLC